MAKLIYLGSWFLTGCISSSAIAWLGTLHPALWRVMWLVYGLATLGIGLAVLLDDAIRPYIKVETETYYGAIIAIAFAILTGGLLTWLSL